MKAQDKADLEKLIDRAIQKDFYLSTRRIVVKEKEAMISYSGGDARKLLNILELVVNGLGDGDIIIDNEAVHRELHENPLMYDKDGEQHYDIVSAMIKSVRGGDPDAAPVLDGSYADGRGGSEIHCPSVDHIRFGGCRFGQSECHVDCQCLF